MTRRVALAVLAVLVLTSAIEAQDVAKTQVFQINPTGLIGGATYNIPAATGPQSKVPNTATIIEAEINLSEAEKLSEGLIIDFGIYFSNDNGQTWVFGNGQTWRSYGPNGLTVVDLDGTVRVNPDPRTQFNVNQPSATYRGWHVKFVVVANRGVQAGGTVRVF